MKKRILRIYKGEIEIYVKIILKLIENNLFQIIIVIYTLIQFYILYFKAKLRKSKKK